MKAQTRRIAVFGAGGHGRVVADCAKLLGYDEIKIFDDRSGPGFTEMCTEIGQYENCTVALGQNLTRLEKLHRLQEAGARLSPLIHPSAIISESATIAGGSFVAAGAIVGPFAKVGFGALLNTSCSIDHDCVLGAGVHVSPGARLAGGVIVEDQVWVGIGAVVREGIQIGARATLGAGAAVVADVTEDMTMLGVPARAATTKAS